MDSFKEPYEVGRKKWREERMGTGGDKNIDVIMNSQTEKYF